MRKIVRFFYSCGYSNCVFIYKTHCSNKDKNHSMASRLGTVVVGGGTGFIGSSLCSRLSQLGYSVLTVSRTAGPRRITWSDVDSRALPEDTCAVVNVAGQNVLDPLHRWSEPFKSVVYKSRVDTTRTLAAAASRLPRATFVSMSGVGFYKPSDSAEYTEESAGGDFDFLSRLCHDWEAAADVTSDVTSDVTADVKHGGSRSVIIRCGVVLGRHGGMIQQVWWPFYLGLGGPVGSGSQFFPWIHIEDIVGLIVHSIQQPNVRGVLNGVAPDIITNAQFSGQFASCLSRPCLVPLPALVVNAVFGQDRGVMMLQGQKVVPRATLLSGFCFKYPDIKSACRQLANPN